MARGRGRANIYAGQIDQSWMKFARCKMCGFKTCINNYPDHKVRLDGFRVRGIFVCPWCRMRMRFGIELYLFVKEFAEKPCKNGEGCNKCRSCKARKLIEEREQYQSHTTTLDTGM